MPLRAVTTLYFLDNRCLIISNNSTLSSTTSIRYASSSAESVTFSLSGSTVELPFLSLSVKSLLNIGSSVSTSSTKDTGLLISTLFFSSICEASNDSLLIGSTIVKVVPLPTSLSYVRLPLLRYTRSRVSESPIPVPIVLKRLYSPSKKSSNKCFLRDSGMPQPLSFTVIITLSYLSLVLTFSSTRPSSPVVYFAEFESRLKIILSNLSVSIHPIILSGWHLMLNDKFFLAINGMMVRAVLRIYAITSPCETSNLSLPSFALVVSSIC